jgi:hypothetical protein
MYTRVCSPEATAMLTARNAVGSGRSSMPGSPTALVLNGMTTIDAISNRFATIVS